MTCIYTYMYPFWYVYVVIGKYFPVKTEQTRLIRNFFEILQFLGSQSASAILGTDMVTHSVIITDSFASSDWLLPMFG